MRRKSCIAFIIIIIIAASFIGIYKWDNGKITKIDKNQVSESINENIRMEIESVQDENKYLAIKGWIIEKGVTHEYFNWVAGEGKNVYINNQIVLIDKDNIIVGFSTVSESRPDINEKINDGIDYQRCGVNALIKRSKLQKGKSYTIGILKTDLDGKKTLVMSDKEIVI